MGWKRLHLSAIHRFLRALSNVHWAGSAGSTSLKISHCHNHQHHLQHHYQQHQNHHDRYQNQHDQHQRQFHHNKQHRRHHHTGSEQCALCIGLALLRGWAKPKPTLFARTEIPVFASGLPKIPAYRLQMSGRKLEDFFSPCIYFRKWKWNRCTEKILLLSPCQ